MFCAKTCIHQPTSNCGACLVKQGIPSLFLRPLVSISSDMQSNRAPRYPLIALGNSNAMVRTPRGCGHGTPAYAIFLLHILKATNSSSFQILHPLRKSYWTSSVLISALYLALRVSDFLNHLPSLLQSFCRPCSRQS